MWGQPPPAVRSSEARHPLPRYNLAMRRFVLLLLLSSLLLAAQTVPEVEITAEPHHHLILENKSVRVFYVEVPPHTDTLMHWHRHDYVYVVLGAAEVVNQVKGKAALAVKLQDGQTEFLPGNFAHVAHNPTDGTFRNVTIEILEDAKLRQAPTHWDESRGLDILQGGTKEILWVKDGVRASEFELQPGGVVPPHHYAGEQLFVAVSDLDLRVDVPLKGPNPVAMPAHLKSGEAQWMPAGESSRMTNVGPKPARFVTLEFP